MNKALLTVSLFGILLIHNFPCMQAAPPSPRTSSPPRTSSSPSSSSSAAAAALATPAGQSLDRGCQWGPEQAEAIRRAIERRCAAFGSSRFKQPAQHDTFLEVGGNSLTRTTSSKLLVYTHMPKTGGTSMQEWLKKQSVRGSKPGVILVNGATVPALVKEMRRSCRGDSKCILMGHNAFSLVRSALSMQGGVGINEVNNSSAVAFATTLRDPAETMVSMFDFVARNPRHPCHGQLLKAYPQRDASAWLDDVLRVYDMGCLDSGDHGSTPEMLAHGQNASDTEDSLSPESRQSTNVTCTAGNKSQLFTPAFHFLEQVPHPNAHCAFLDVAERGQRLLRGDDAPAEDGDNMVPPLSRAFDAAMVLATHYSVVQVSPKLQHGVDILCSRVPWLDCRARGLPHRNTAHQAAQHNTQFQSERHITRLQELERLRHAMCPSLLVYQAAETIFEADLACELGDQAA